MRRRGRTVPSLMGLASKSTTGTVVAYIHFLMLILIGGADAHGSLIMPQSRNSVDSELPAWSDGKHPETGLIEPYDCGCNNGTSECKSGQSCFWFSQGTSIGCSNATGNGTRIPNLDHCPEERPEGFVPSDLLKMPGALHPKYRTVNLNAAPGSVNDIWKYNPWRAPGKAPIADSCGMAGGNTYEVFNAGAYNTTRYAKQGDLGTHVLPPRPSGTVWQRGTVAKARWQLTASHAGGYQYRLCPSGEPLTEECFKKTPLALAKPHRHTVVMPDPSQDYEIPATVVEEGGGIGWIIHPMGAADAHPCDWNPAATGQHCDYVNCPRCGAPWYAADGACPCACGAPDRGGISGGHFPELDQSLPFGNSIKNLAKSNTIEDQVEVPSTIAAGDYVLQWRWDCEGTSQVWTTCADITIG